MYPFYPGQTDYQVITLPFASDDVGTVLVSYKQGGRVVLEKEASNKEAIDEESCSVSLLFTQAESLKFIDGEDILVQVNVTGASGGRVTSVPIVLPCGDQYHRRVM